MKVNIPETSLPRVVIIGGGFAGLTLAKKLSKRDYTVVLVDKNNYHQFQPLFYQVATAGLEPSSIVYPFRKIFQSTKNLYFRLAEVTGIHAEKKQLQTTAGLLNYDYLVIATGAETNYFGNAQIAANVLPMKSVSEALYLRNAIISDFENALTSVSMEERQSYMDVIIVGGGPTGVEVAGALAEMRNHILPKDYPELNWEDIDIHVVQGSPVLLEGMSAEASEAALRFLQKLGVKVQLNARVTDYNGEYLTLHDGTQLYSRKVIWAAGVSGSSFAGLPAESFTRGKRLKVNRFNEVEGLPNVYAVGDIALMVEEEKFPNGHPQVAQVALQQAAHLAKNLNRRVQQLPPEPFRYKDLGSMATIGKNKAVVDLPWWKTQGVLAWFAWLFIHLLQLIGFKNKVFVLINWVWNYFTYDPSLRLIIRPTIRTKDKRQPVAEAQAAV